MKHEMYWMRCLIYCGLNSHFLNVKFYFSYLVCPFTKREVNTHHYQLVHQLLVGLHSRVTVHVESVLEYQVVPGTSRRNRKRLVGEIGASPRTHFHFSFELLWILVAVNADWSQLHRLQKRFILIFGLWFETKLDTLAHKKFISQLISKLLQRI